MNSSLMLRRFFCFNSTTTAVAAASSTSSKKKPLVFLGSPQVAATVLDALFKASKAPNSLFEVAAIVTQPPAKRDRGKKLMPSPVAEFALDTAFPSDLILTPERAGEDTFLSTLRALQPELCITAAYGNILPTKFLNIPPMGTVNIHPSLLPLYRGAAPVQRALQAPDLLALLFSEGSKLLIHELPSILDGSARLKAQPQDDSKATLAPKISVDESWLSFDQEASVLHNKVRAFAGWPGTRAKVAIVDDENGRRNIVELKIITTRVCDHSIVQGDEADDITYVKDSLVFPCGRSTALEVLELQLPGKKVFRAAAFWNGLRGQKLKKL
ncbi:PREDICTED: methionyl-tRNA formyltransferase, mitochondrial isoform X3 [Populus euphratica]|uniref:methionyl-tRNA formyltransferase n=1 Tax=Populus euphratica TaxID=75702 RepID=A0AAJ6XJV5_POPEU|nr:PREDICTED: methionyl-tRNA formyltransferase, mitochondrial isoform X3 [Populus euphratica]